MNDSQAFNRSGLNWGTDDEDLQPARKPGISETPDLGKRGDDFASKYSYEVVDASRGPLIFHDQGLHPVSQSSQPLPSVRVDEEP